ncbi:NYN domain-containing protein [Paeniglutamicibacter sulfureus]|uniref:NYN domain-containing protein n=1 Tax=Paeniglutamicibacter sulfureus TaxID=43666 RepID=UPI00345CC0AF
MFVIATGDGGFIPLVRRLHALNKYVVVVSTDDPESGVVNALLKTVADEYHQVPMSQVSVKSQM